MSSSSRYTQQLESNRENAPAIFDRYHASVKLRTESPCVSWTRYILDTALNWHGPIEEFNLIVDKLHPQAVLAMSPLDIKTPLRQIGQTTYEFKAKKFYPKINLSILVVDPSN